MLPIVLLSWLAGEIGFYLLLARGLFDAPWSLAIAAALGGVLGIRAGINALTWMFGMIFASPAPRLGGKRTARLMLAEFGAFLLSFILVIPFERLWLPKDRLPPAAGRLPVLLVHGYGCSRGVWWLLRRRLEAAGHVVATVSLFPPQVAMGRLVPQLKQRIDEVCTATGAKQLVLIGHSMGGLICRSYLARHGNAQVARLLTLATPHQGTELARVGIGQNAREMLPESLWLSDMNQEAMTVPACSLRNPYDNYVMPQDNQRHPQMQDVELPPVGHLAMLYDRRIANLLIDLLKTQP